MPSVIRANILMQKAFAGLDNHTPAGVQEAQRLFEEVQSVYKEAIEVEHNALEAMAQSAQLKVFMYTQLYICILNVQI
jgi:hypothetical protein